MDRQTSRSSFCKRKREDQENENYNEKRLSIGTLSKEFELNAIVGSSSAVQSPLIPREVLCEHDLNSCRSILTPGPILRNDKKLALPTLKWSDCKKLWDFMCIKDSQLKTQRDEHMFTRHENIEPHMRAILLDWVIEVCEVYKMQRETYYLAVDYLDRYLSKSRNVAKKELQLTGITCLFIAAKVEEIYPPKLSEFAYVTDGACNTEDIILMELVILKTLNWNLSSVTVHTWLNFYLQLCHNSLKPDTKDCIMLPSYSTRDFTQVSQLMDLCILDSSSLQYSYSVLAASAVYVSLRKFQEVIFTCSGINRDSEDFKKCTKWMSSYNKTIQESKAKVISPTKYMSTSPMPNGVFDGKYLVQTHSVSVELWREAKKQLKLLETPEASVLMTPPNSDCKTSAYNEDDWQN